MGYLGTPPQSGFITTAKQRVTSSTNNYVDLDHAISSIADVIVFVNFVKQDTTNLTLTTSTRITLGGTLVSSDVVEIHYLGKAVNTQTPGTATVTNDMLAGSIANSKLANSSITLNGSAVSLGGTSSIDVTPAWHAHLSSSYNVNNNTETALPFDVEVLDTDSAYNTSNGKFTVPSGEGGKYFVYAQAMRNNFFNSRYLVKIRVGGTAKISAEDRNTDSGGTTFQTVQVAGILDLNASDEVDVSLYQDSGSSAGANGGSNSKSHFMGFKLIGV